MPIIRTTDGLLRRSIMNRVSSAVQRPLRGIFVLAVISLPLFAPFTVLPLWGESGGYVGTEACKGCHEEVYARFTAHSKKHASFKSIAIRKKGLTAEEITKCYECHTTGYGKPGGFKSEAETPGLKNLGCEACHGPGSAHAAAGDPKAIKRKMDVKDCESCHSKERVAAFSYKPVLFGGAH